MLVCVPVESSIDLGLTMRTLDPHKKQCVLLLVGTDDSWTRIQLVYIVQLSSHSDKQERAHGEFYMLVAGN